MVVNSWCSLFARIVDHASDEGSAYKLKLV